MNSYVNTKIYFDGLYIGKKLINIRHLRILTKLGQVRWEKEKPTLNIKKR